MALTTQQEEILVQIIEAYQNGKRLQDLPEVQGTNPFNLITEVLDEHLFEEEREGSKKGIAQASQESVDELNGRATAIQGHTYSIAENTQQLLATANAILNSVLVIRDNTDSLGAKVDTMNEQIRVMRNDISDITTKGIIIKR